VIAIGSGDPGALKEDEMSTSRSPGRISRRRFLEATAGTAAWVAVGGVAGLAATTLAGKPVASKRNPLFVPTTATPENFSLRAAPGQIDLGGGRTTRAWVYNGLMPGPTLIASTGDSASITLYNGLSQPTITHWHGMLVNHENDGHPMKAVDPGGTYVYEFPIMNRAALNWYHPHPHMLTGEQVAMGLAGAFIIRDDEETALGLPSGTHEVPLVLRDTDLDRTGNIVYKPRSGGWLGTYPLVNGTRDPYLTVDQGIYRFRVLGGANARIFGLALDNGLPFKLIGNDGGLLAEASDISQVDIAPGERLDLLVDFGPQSAGTRIMLRDVRSGWNLLEFQVGSTSATGTMPVGTLSTIVPLAGPSTVTRSFSFDGMTKINGREYDMHRIDFTVPFGVTERWRFTTNGNAPHPVHVHGASFQVVSRTGGRGRIFPWEGGWKDTVLLEDRETVDVMVRFDAYRGLYLMHCHKLEHEDMGMMANFEVI
jgi:FtsP/CotA-like multicopper oxidase with cupredoxin domain